MHGQQTKLLIQLLSASGHIRNHEPGQVKQSQHSPAASSLQRPPPALVERLLAAAGMLPVPLRRLEHVHPDEGQQRQISDSLISQHGQHH